MTVASSHKCPSCDAPLNFDAASGMQHCGYCGSSFTIEQVEEYNARGTKPQGGDDAPAGSAGEASVTAGSFDWGAYKKDLDLQQMEEVKTYVCRNCGAEVVATAVTAATTCPYCNNNVVIDERLSGGLRPNGIIPFSIPKEQLSSLLTGFYKDRPLLPKGFFDENKVEKAQGIYVPFWLFDATADGSANFEGTKTHVFETRDERVVETSHYRLYREGEVRFEAIPVDGSERMDNDVMDSIEPFNYEGLVAYRPEYLTGYVADRFDRSPDEELNRASVRMEASTLDAFETTCFGYETVTPRSNAFCLKDTSVNYVLLPVYLFNSEYNGKKYRYAINGQTGKVVGEVPICRKKAFRAFIIPAAVVSVVTYVLLTVFMTF